MSKQFFEIAQLAFKILVNQVILYFEWNDVTIRIETEKTPMQLRK